MRLFVGNLSFQTTNEDLQELFSFAGKVKSARVITYHDSGRSRGFGFVEMASASDGEAAIARFNNVEIGGRRLQVSEALPRTYSDGVSVGAHKEGTTGRPRERRSASGRVTS